MELRVSDSGPGIPPDERGRIFHELHRLDPTRAEGRGLGLATSRRIARRLGGGLKVEETDGGGAAFVLHLPCGLDDRMLQSGRVGAS